MTGCGLFNINSLIAAKSSNSTSTASSSTTSSGDITSNILAIEVKKDDYQVFNQKVDKFLQYYFKKYYEWGFKNAPSSTLLELYVQNQPAAVGVSYEIIVGNYEGQVKKYDFKIKKINKEGDKITSVLIDLNINFAVNYKGKKGNVDFVYVMELVPYKDTYQVLNFNMETKDNVEKKKKEEEAKADQYNKGTQTIDTLADYTPGVTDQKSGAGNANGNTATTSTATAGASTDIMTVRQIVEENDPKTVAILIPIDKKQYSQGSAFFIAPGVVVTNFHVINGGSSGVIRTYDAKIYEIDGVIAADAGLDIAVLKLKNKVGSPVRLGDVTKVKKGDNGLTIGSPKGLFNTVSTGIISNKWYDGKINTIQISIPITHGNSGGPLLNEKGEVIGINSSGLEGDGDLNFAISSEHIKRIMEEINAKEFEQIKARSLSDLFKKEAFTSSQLQEFGSQFGQWIN